MPGLLSSACVRGCYILRLGILSFRTHREHVRAAITALREEARALLVG